MNYLEIILVLLTMLGVISSIRIIAGPSVWDRLLAFNLVSSKIIMFITLYAWLTQKSYLLDMAIVYALLGFMGIIMIAGIVQKKKIM